MPTEVEVSAIGQRAFEIKNDASHKDLNQTEWTCLLQNLAVFDHQILIHSRKVDGIEASLDPHLHLILKAVHIVSRLNFWFIDD